MRFGVLGPLAVWSAEGEPVTVPEVKIRTLLALLLAEEGRPVSVARLVDELWGDQQPADPLNTLQTKVSQLRRVLERAEAGARTLLTHTPAGYALHAEEVDVRRFRTLLDQARSGEGVRERAELYRQALACWRGAAYADFAEADFARTVATRLTEERLVATEEWARLRLGLGQEAALAAELAELVAAYPMRERLRVVYLRALYQSGRQAEALAGYDEVRRLLAEELGVDPGAELLALHQAMLRQDAELDAPSRPSPDRAEPADSRTSGGVHQLPVPLTPLLGRPGAVRDVAGWLGSERLVTLTGPGGVGKTRLAVAAGARLRDTFPGGVWFVGLAGVPVGSVGAVEQAVARALAVGDAPGGGDDSLLRTMAGRELLLVLDNCEHVVDETAELTAALLRGAPGLRVLATSREPLALPGERVWPVPPLDESGAIELFHARARAAAPEVDLAASPRAREAVAEVCRRLDGLPLALELAATRVRALGVVELAARLNDRFAVLGAGTRGVPRRQRTLRALIDWSWELLTAREQRVLRRLSVFTDGTSLAAAEVVCADEDVAPAEVVEALARLVDSSLVLHTEPGVRDESAVRDAPAAVPRYRLLESVAAYGRERLAEAAEADVVGARFVRCYGELTRRAADGLYGPEQRQRLAALDAESGNVRAALGEAARLGLAEDALRIAGSLGWYWFLRGRYQEGEQLLAAALAQEPDGGEENGGRLRTTAEVWHGLFALLCGRPSGTAFHAWARWPRTSPGEVSWTAPEVARTRWLIALGYWTAGDLPQSERWLSLALPGLDGPTDPCVGWTRAAAELLHGDHALLRGELAAARKAGQHAAEAFAELTDGWGQTQSTALLASLAEISGEYAEAGRLSARGLEWAQELRLWPEVADRLWALGRVELLRGQLPYARTYFERSRAVAVEHGYPSGVIHAESALGLAARRLGELTAAEGHFTPLLDEYQRIDFGPGKALVLAELGFVAAARGDVAGAWTLHLDGLAVAVDTTDPRAVALALEGLAEAWLLRGEPVRAAELLGTAEAARLRAGVPLPAGERADVDRITTAVRAALADSADAQDTYDTQDASDTQDTYDTQDAYDAAYARGQRADLWAVAETQQTEDPPG